MGSLLDLFLLLFLLWNCWFYDSKNLYKQSCMMLRMVQGESSKELFLLFWLYIWKTFPNFSSHYWNHSKLALYFKEEMTVNYYWKTLVGMGPGKVPKSESAYRGSNCHFFPYKLFLYNLTKKTANNYLHQGTREKKQN